MTDKLFPDAVASHVESLALTPAEASLHNNFVVSAKSLRRDFVRMVYYLLQIKEHLIYRKLGFKTMSNYGKAVAGLTPRQVSDFLTLARRLPRFPEVEAALAEGNLSWSHARIITSKADPEQQLEWIKAAGTLTVEQLAATPSHSVPNVFPEKKSPESQPSRDGGLPMKPKPQKPKVLPETTLQYVNLRLTGSQYAELSRLLEQGQAATGLSREEIVLQALENAATGKTQHEQSAYLQVILVCPDCGEAVLPTSRGEIRAPQALLKAAHCDAIIEDSTGARKHTIPPRIRRQALKRARYQCERPGCSNTGFLQIHHRVPRAGGGSPDLDNLVVLCSRCHQQLHHDEESARAALKQVPDI